MLYTEHDREMPAPWRHRVLHRWLARRVTATVAVCDRLRRDLVRTEGFPPDRTATLVKDPGGSTSLSVALKSGSLLTFEAKKLEGADVLRQAARAFPVAALDDYLAGR